MTLKAVPEGVKELTGLDDTQLMVAVQQGNDMAFRALVERYKKKAYYTALKLVARLTESQALISSDVSLKESQSLSTS